MSYEYPKGPVSEVRKIALLEERVARLEKVLSQVSHAARLLALADNYSALETLDAATLSDVPHDLAGAALGTHARAIEGLTALCEVQQGRIEQLECLLLTVAQSLFYHKESHEEAGSHADEELAGTVALLREARAASQQPFGDPERLLPPQS